MVSSFKYLGVHLQSNGRWDAQFLHVETKLRKWAYRIGRVIVKGSSSPSVLAVRELYQAYMLSTLSYGLPLWSPTSTQFKTLQTIMIKPLRRALLLPDSTPVDAVLAEFSTPSVISMRQLQTLQYARRLHRSAASHFTATRFRDNYAQPPPADGYIEIARPFVANLRFVESKSCWGVTHDSDANFKAISTQRTFDRFKQATTSRAAPMRALRSAASIPNYLHHDPRPVAAARARLRFGVANVNAILHQHHLRATPACSHCAAPIDNIEHMLLECPQFISERAACAAALAALNLPLNLTTILSRDDEEATSLQATASFISSVFSIRDF